MGGVQRGRVIPMETPTLPLAGRGFNLRGYGSLRMRGVPLEFYASSRCRLLGLLTVLEGPTDIDEPKHRDGWAIEHPCRPTADANAEVPF